MGGALAGGWGGVWAHTPGAPPRGAADAGELAQKLAWLRAHPEDAARMGRNARALAEREFDRDKLAARVLAVLEEVAR